VSSWFFVGSGPSFLDQGAEDLEGQPALQIDAGMGSSPEHRFVAGGVGRVLPHFGKGVDLALLVRLAPQPYVLGKWGFAVDVGGYQRFWGQGSSGGMATLSVGAPYGLTLGLTGAYGTNDAQTYIATLGIDFARLTVHRHSGLDWWRNPYPSPRRAE
jgi:hypothetical protein